MINVKVKNWLTFIVEDKPVIVVMAGRVYETELKKAVDFYNRIVPKRG